MTEKLTDQKLTAKQAAFIEEYLVDLNGRQAAIRAGYSPTTAHVMAWENLRKPHVALAVDRALADRCGVTRTRIVDELAKIAFSDIRQVVSWRPDGVTVTDSAELDPDAAAAVAEVSQGPNGVRVRLHDKPAALEKLGRALQLFAERVEVTGRVETRSEIEIGRRLAFVLELIARGKINATLPAALPPPEVIEADG